MEARIIKLAGGLTLEVR
jgi:RimJ/RimL family protein N-acetyltransferase